MKVIEQIDPADLVPYEHNARMHSDEQVGMIAASISEFGFVNPVLINPLNEIIAGHGRYAAALKLGLKSIPAVRVDHFSEAQRRAYVIADNRLAEHAGWDDEALESEMVYLEGIGFNLDVIGFDIDEIANMLNRDTGEVKEKPKKEKHKGYFLEVEFPDEKSLLAEYEGALSRGLIARVKNG